MKQFIKESDMSANVTYTYAVANRWLGFRFDLAILMLTTVCAALSIFMKNYF